LQTMM